ncbi:MAG: hypothetical protein ACK5JT_21455 [Hyphomicrobiaceae bacterium]
MRRIALIASLMAGTLATAAEARSGSFGHEDLKKAVSGKTVKISTPIGLPLTVNYGANGIMVGSVGSALAAYLGSAKDRGRWKIRNGKLCQKWFKWLASEEICMELSQAGGTIHWRTDSGRTGTAEIQPGPPELEGRTASALGVPPPVETPKPTIARQEPEPPKPQPRQHVQSHAKAHTASRKAKAAPAAPEPRLIEQPHEITLAVARADMTGGSRHGARVTLASLGSSVAPALPRHAMHQPSTSPSLLMPEHRETMRSAANDVVQMSFEQRWCHGHTQADNLALPSLMAIAIEQTSPTELPLPAAACLTAEPMLHIVSKEELR